MFMNRISKQNYRAQRLINAINNTHSYGLMPPPNSQPVATGAHTSGNATLTLDGDVRGAKVAVTLEPGPGAQAPSVRPFLIGDAPA
jgi:hypothetical protein